MVKDNTWRVEVLIWKGQDGEGQHLESGGPDLEGQDGEGQNLESGGPGMEGQDGEEEGVRVLYLIGGWYKQCGDTLILY